MPIFKNVCRACSSGCGVNVLVEDGKAVAIEGNPDFPVNRGGLCPRGAAALQVVSAPDRVLYPLKRTGERGEGRWERITWEEALDTVAARLSSIKAAHGPRSLAFMAGQQWHYSIANLLHDRFRSAVMQTPNWGNHAHMCSGPNTAANALTYGFNYVARSGLLGYIDHEHHPCRCMVLWGANPFTSRSGRARRILDWKEQGAKFIVVDPYLSSAAQKADLWLQPKPDTDVVLALAMANVIISRELYDKDFVRKWTSGFDRFSEHVKNYTPEKASAITWVPADRIEKAAVLYATSKPASLEDHVGVSHTWNGFAAHQALAILRALAGNLDVKGGEVWLPPIPYFADHPKNTLRERVEGEGIGVEKFPLFLSLKGNRNGPAGQNAQSSCYPGAILEADPYPLKAFVVVGANPVVTSGPNRAYAERAFRNLEFLVVMDLFLSATAQLADIVLPAAWWLEKVDISESQMVESRYTMLRQPVPPPGECWPESRMILTLAKKMGCGQDFPWNSAEELVDEFFQPLRLNELKENPDGMWMKGCKLPDDLRYRKYEETGFDTPSKKVEFYSQRLEHAGLPPLPGYRDYVEVLAGETGIDAGQLEHDYPLILSKHNTWGYAHSQFRKVPILRELEPDPVLEVHPETARALGIADGDEVSIESPFGAITARAELTFRVHPKVVFMLHGWEEADVMRLVGHGLSPVIGCPVCRGIRVRIGSRRGGPVCPPAPTGPVTGDSSQNGQP